MGRATLEASLGGGILATQASACLYIDILVLLGPFLCAVWLLDEWVSSTPHLSTPSPFGGLYYYSLAFTGKSEKLTAPEHQHSAYPSSAPLLDSGLNQDYKQPGREGFISSYSLHH